MPEVINIDAVYKKLKKQNGEGVAKVIRDAVLLDVPNIVHILEFAGNNPQEVQQLIPVIREVYKEKLESEYVSDKNPLELLDEAGYDAFVVDSLEKQNSIKKYFRSGEELCTFRDPARYKNYYMIHAVKRGADKIEPSDNPKRQDEYGTSVISIQIAKGGGFISIKNRYNHTINNPDATFDNNPDNIIPGLSNSLKEYFHVDFNVSKAPLPENFQMVNDQLVRYNYEINNVYFGPDYYFSGSDITKINKDYEIMLDYFILDTKTRQVRDIVNTEKYGCTAYVLNEVFNGKKIERKVDKGETHIFADGIQVAVVSDGKIVELNLPNVTEIGDSFLAGNNILASIDLPNVKKIGDNFLKYNAVLTSINAPNVEEIGQDFLVSNRLLESIDLPNVRLIGNGFLQNSYFLTSINLPNAEKIGHFFLSDNPILTAINLPKVKKIGNDFLVHNEVLNSIKLPNVEKIGDRFLEYNRVLKSIELPNVKIIGEDFFVHYEGLERAELPNVEKIGKGFLMRNNNMKIINLPKVRQVGNNFLTGNAILESLNAPELEIIGDDFLTCNKSLKELNLPKALGFGRYSLRDIDSLISINVPKANDIGALNIINNKNIKYLYGPNLPEDKLERAAIYGNTNVKLAIAQNKIMKKINAEFDKLKQDTAERIDVLNEKMDVDLAELKSGADRI